MKLAPNQLKGKIKSLAIKDNVDARVFNENIYDGTLLRKIIIL